MRNQGGKGIKAEVVDKSRYVRQRLNSRKEERKKKGTIGTIQKTMYPHIFVSTQLDPWMILGAFSCVPASCILSFLPVSPAKVILTTMHSHPSFYVPHSIPS